MIRSLGLMVSELKIVFTASYRHRLTKIAS
jgi:hypothetical protein